MECPLLSGLQVSMWNRKLPWISTCVSDIALSQPFHFTQDVQTQVPIQPWMNTGLEVNTSESETLLCHYLSDFEQIFQLIHSEPQFRSSQLDFSLNNMWGLSLLKNI